MKTLSKEKLTAYALEELSATERAEFEALLAASPEDQEYAGETREFCQLLQASIGGDAEEAVLTAAQKQGIVDRIVSQRQASVRSLRWRKRIILSFIGTSAGAAAAVMLFGPYFKKSAPGELVALQKASVPKADGYSDADILAQKEVVKEKRAEMIRHMKQYGIVDFSAPSDRIGADSADTNPDQSTYASNATPAPFQAIL